MVTRIFYGVQGQFKVNAPTETCGLGLINHDTEEVILEEGESYSQTVTFVEEVSQDQINGFLEAVLSLCAGVREMQDGAYLSDTPGITKKIITTHALLG